MSDRLSREWLPFAPLQAHRPMFKQDRNGPYGGVNTGGEALARAWCRAQAKGWITVGMADEICVHLLKMHPAEVYQEMWWE